MAKKHHEIPLQVLLIPGGFLLLSIILLVVGSQEWAFLMMGIAILVAILIHKE